MTRLSWAIWDPITDRDRAFQTPVRMTVHTAWVDAADIYGPHRGQGSTFAHVYNPTRGKLRQHQELDRRSRADLDGNGLTVSVENQDERREMPFSESQLDNMAHLFAELVLAPGSKVPNRIATVDDTRGLAWHRLGCLGNFGAYNPRDITTWSGQQTGERWTTVRGKTCPTNPRIRQIPEIFARAQQYIDGRVPVAGVGGLVLPPPKPALPKPAPKTFLEELMADAIVYTFFEIDGHAWSAVANSLDRTWARFPSESVKTQFAAYLDRNGIPRAWHSSQTDGRLVREPSVFGREVPWS